jgi:hypothetical protein
LACAVGLAPGVGVVKVQTKGETLRLDSSTLVQPQDECRAGFASLPP